MASKPPKNNLQKIKNNGQVYTPQYLVDNILNFVGYSLSNDILQKHIIDNSCGDGAFLKAIVDIYCQKFFVSKSNKNELKNELEKYIHGIEIQPEEAQKCITNLNDVASVYGLTDVNWDIVIADSLTVDHFNHKMDFVVGNPPYVRVHNLESNYNNVKKFAFAKKGMIDLYIVFFELGFSMLNKKGKMCLITPSSFLTSKAGAGLRTYILKHKYLAGVIDLEHFQPFDATTYTIISLFDFAKTNKKINYFKYNTELLQPEKICELDYDDFVINNNFYFAKKDDLDFLKSIKSGNIKISNNTTVKNGFATLADNVFIQKGLNEKEKGVINILKASTGKWYKCIFPYEKNLQPITENKLIKEYNYINNILEQNKQILTNRSLAVNTAWYVFGRSQGIKDIYKTKFAINTIIKDLESIKLNMVKPGEGVYSGLYILSDLSFEEIKNIVVHEGFLRYVKVLKKYKSGGYYTFSSSDLMGYINCH